MSTTTTNQKVVATLQARSRWQAFNSTQVDGTFLVARWGHWRDLGSTAEAETFLRRVSQPSQIHVQQRGAP